MVPRTKTSTLSAISSARADVPALSSSVFMWRSSGSHRRDGLSLVHPWIVQNRPTKRYRNRSRVRDPRIERGRMAIAGRLGTAGRQRRVFGPTLCAIVLAARPPTEDAAGVEVCGSDIQSEA